MDGTYINIFDDGGVEAPVERVRWVGLPRLGFEQVLDPVPSVGQTFPQAVSVDLPLYQLLPEHPLRDDPGPLLAHGPGSAQRLGVQEGEDVLGDVIQTLQGHGQMETEGSVSIYLFRQERDEVPLEHWLEKCIDSAVLVVLHGLEQLLHELYLVLLSPGGEVVHADITLF